MQQERIIVLVDAGRKAEIEAKAKSFNMSVGEFARRSMEAYDPELERLSAVLVESTRDAKEALAKAHADIDETLEYFANRRAEAAPPREASADRNVMALAAAAEPSSRRFMAADTSVIRGLDHRHVMHVWNNDGDNSPVISCQYYPDEALVMAGGVLFVGPGHSMSVFKDELLKAGVHFSATRQMHAGGSVSVGPVSPVTRKKPKQTEGQK